MFFLTYSTIPARLKITIQSSIEKVVEICVALNHRQVGVITFSLYLFFPPEIEAFPSQRTLVALQFPPHVVALACIYLAALLSTFEQNETNGPDETQNNLRIVTILRDHGPWEKKFQAQVDDLEGEL